MDDHDAGAPGSRPDAEDAANERTRGPAREYTWESRPGEDFGPIAPPAAGPPPRERRLAVDPLSQPESEIDPEWIPPASRTAVTERVEPGPQGSRRTPPPPRRRRWRPILTAIGALVLLGTLAAAVLLVISRQATETETTPDAPPVVQTTAPSPAAASPQPTSTAALAVPPAASPAPAASPTPLALAPPTASPPPARSPVVTNRASPVVVPTLPSLIAPPGQRFATSTPARLGTPLPTRTPPPVPTLRPVSFASRVWSEQVLNRVGDNASICGAASTGANAQVSVMAPDRSMRTLGEFQPPAERVCYTMKLDEAGLYVLSLIIKDASGNEIDRQAGALQAGR